MKKLVYIILTLSLSAFCKGQAQNKSATLTLFTGLINYQGDLQPNSFTFSHSNFAMGLTIRKNIDRWFSLRAGFAIGKIEAADRYNRDYLKPRNLSFFNTISEINAGLELNILDFATKHFTPYFYGGIAVFHSNPWTHDSEGTKTFLQPLSTEGQGLSQFPDIEAYGFYQLAIVFGGGFKVAVSENISIGIEFNQRKSFTDYIDDVSTHFIDRDVLLREKGPKAVELAYRGDELPGGSSTYPAHGEQRGTASEMDWYYFLGTTIGVRLNTIGNVFKKAIASNHGSHNMKCPRNVAN